MFEHHRKSPWFAEKYDLSPQYMILRKRVRKEGWKGRMNTFLANLEAGQFDPDLNESTGESTSAPTQRQEADNKKDESDSARFEDVSNVHNAGDELKADDEAGLDAEDDVGDHDGGRGEPNGKSTIDGKRSNRGEEIAVYPEGNQVMIRTIPPDIGRMKLETVGVRELGTFSNPFSLNLFFFHKGTVWDSRLYLSCPWRSSAEEELLSRWMVEVP